MDTARIPDGAVVAGGSRRWLTLIDGAIAAFYAAFFLGYTLVLLRSKVLDLPLFTGLGIPVGMPAVDVRLELLTYASIALLLACAAGLAVRRTHPPASFAIVFGATALQLIIGEPISLWNIAVPASLFSAAAYGTRAFGWLVILVTIAGYGGLWALATGLLGRLDLLLNPLAILGTSRGAVFVASLAVLVLIWAFGDQVRASRERYEDERRRAIELAHERDTRARLDALAERHRIARELHDVVAHGLSVMIVQADGARYAADEHPEAPREALAVISSTGRESLAEMRRLLGVLRGGEEPSLAPQPDLAGIPQLVDGFREAGLAVELALDDPLPPTAPAVALAAYRIVQESLTNVLKHAGRASVRVAVAARPGTLAIRVANGPGDALPPPPGGSTGLGLTGMRERVRLLGGRLTAAPLPDGGFEVVAELPTTGADGTPAAARDPRGLAPRAERA